MQLRTEARDCLYLNWAVPRAALPAPPGSLRYELHRVGDVDLVFVSALLFRLTGLRPSSLPGLALSYPQMSLRLYVLDEEDVPSVLYQRLMVPPWVVPISRLLGRQPAHPGRFSYPRPSVDRTSDRDVDRDVDRQSGRSSSSVWSWSLGAFGVGAAQLEVEARLGSPSAAVDPSLGDWQRTVDYFRRRPRGYVSWEGEVRAIARDHPRVAVWPLQVHVSRHDLLERAFRRVDPAVWRRPHSAWICPDIPIQFQVGPVELLPMPRRAVAAVPDGA